MKELNGISLGTNWESFCFILFMGSVFLNVTDVKALFETWHVLLF